jgi:hypothetical protein
MSEKARITVDEIAIIEVSNNPSITPGVDAPIGSLAILDGGAQKWQKFGPLFTDWKEDVSAEFVEGYPRAGIPLTYNGTVNNGNWISYTELISTPRIIFPVKIRVKEITWVNTNLNLGSFTFDFYKNGQLNPVNLINTYTPTSTERVNGYGYSSELNIDFNPGESLFIKYNKPSGGTSLSDLGLILWVARWG